MSRREDDHVLRRPMDRRRALTFLGAAVAGATGALAAACARKSSPSGAGASPSTSATSSDGSAGGGQSPDCVLTPELTEGPYYIDLNDVRSDITEGRSGAAMKLAITVVDATSCTPVKDAAVDIWHCDAGGEYSGFGSASGSAEMPPGGPPGGGPPGGRQATTNAERFLRGTQVTEATGLCTFQTIYPGWYTGRAVHIHVKVHTGGEVVHTGQLFFDDDFTDTVYKGQPYAKRSARDTRNDADSIFGQSGGSGLVDIKANGAGYDASTTLGVKPA
jgi:protocatechuate 3,4-dioxygenase beta subunit